MSQRWYGNLAGWIVLLTVMMAIALVVMLLGGAFLVLRAVLIAI